MGELDLDKANEVALEIKGLINSEEFTVKEEVIEEKSEIKWVCPVCGYIHYGDNAPEKCPLCGVPKELFKKQ